VDDHPQEVLHLVVDQEEAEDRLLEVGLEVLLPVEVPGEDPEELHHVVLQLDRQDLDHLQVLHLAFHQERILEGHQVVQSVRQAVVCLPEVHHQVDLEDLHLVAFPPVVVLHLQLLHPLVLHLHLQVLPCKLFSLLEHLHHLNLVV
jgi:hypothetical protein